MSKYSSAITRVKVLEKTLPAVREFPLHMFEFHWVDGRVEQKPGKSVSDAFNKAGYGLAALPLVDFFVKIPKGEPAPEFIPPLYQVFVMKTRKDNWEPVGNYEEEFEMAENNMEFEVDTCQRFSAIVVNVNTDKIYAWKWR